MLLVVAVLRDELVWPQKLLRSSPGDGGKQTPESLISGRYVQRTCAGECIQCQDDLPLSLYSALLSSLKSMDFGGALGVFSTTPEAGRAFSSCLRNGLRMMGIVAIAVCEWFVRSCPGRIVDCWCDAQ